MIVWKLVAEHFFLKKYTDVPVIIKNVSFKRATIISKEAVTELFVSISAHTGYFEIFESGEMVVTGSIQGYEKLPTKLQQPHFDDSSLVLKKSDIYKEYLFRKQVFQDSYQGIFECDIQGTNGRIKWVENISSFMECMTQLTVCEMPNLRGIILQTFIEKLTIDPVTFFKTVSVNTGNYGLYIMSKKQRNINYLLQKFNDNGDMCTI